MPSFLKGLVRRIGTIKRTAEPNEARTRHATRLGVEPLEERLLLSWTSVPASIPTSGAVRAYLNVAGDSTGSAYITYGEVDRYYFDAVKSGVYRFMVSTPFSSLDSILGVFDSAGKRLAGNDDVSTAVTDSQLTLSLVGGRRYYFGITNYTGTPVGRYTWNVDGPQNLADDAYEDNDSMSRAYYLGTPTSARTVYGLALADFNDYYRFRLAATGPSGSYVSINFSHSRGNLNLALLNSVGTTVRQSTGYGDSERVSLGGLPAGDYIIRVYGHYGAKNYSYSLTINPGPVLSAANRVLNLNFDGVYLSRSDLNRYAGSDWSGSLKQMDADVNGVVVQPFLRGRSDRTQIINRMLTLIQEDLRPFGITARRVTGKAVEGVGATTIFLGRSTLTGGFSHLSPDIDYGNNNRTDIAFVGDEYWGSVEKTALAMADVTLHEAGHTWGLYHVRSGYTPETMGIRYSLDPSRWAANTGYTNYAFAEYYSDGGGRGTQNSYVTMAVTFGLVSGSVPIGPGGPAGNLATPFQLDMAANAGVEQVIELDCGITGVFSYEHGRHTGCCCAGCGKPLDVDEYVVFQHEPPSEEEPPETIVTLSDLGENSVEELVHPILPVEHVPVSLVNQAWTDQVWTDHAPTMPPEVRPAMPAVSAVRGRDLPTPRPLSSLAELLEPAALDLNSAFNDLDWLVIETASAELARRPALRPSL